MPAIRPRALDRPHPTKARSDVNPAIGRESTTCEGGVDAGKEEREQAQAQHPRTKPQGRAIKPHPRSEGEAPGDLGQRGEQIQGKCHRPQPARRHGDKQAIAREFGTHQHRDPGRWSITCNYRVGAEAWA